MNKKALLVVFTVVTLVTMGCGWSINMTDPNSPMFVTATTTPVVAQPTSTPVVVLNVWSPAMGDPGQKVIEECVEPVVNYTTYLNNQPFWEYDCAQVRQWVVDNAPVVPTLVPTATAAASVPTQAPTATATSVVSSCAAPAANYKPFSYKAQWDMSKLSTNLLTAEEFLQVHGLTRDQVQFIHTPKEDVGEVNLPAASWEPGLYVVELKPEFYGKIEIPMNEGWQYSPALSDGSAEVFWGGDPNLDSACLEWGFSARMVKAYEGLDYNWLDDNIELVAREYRFGRNLRNKELEGLRSDVPYFNRVGPYYTGPGNVDTGGWVPPSLDESVAKDWRDACAMYGGLCNPEEWTKGEKSGAGYLNWHWAYSLKDAGSADYCPVGMPCWQVPYHPGGPGYVELWLGAGATGPSGKPVVEGGPYKFYYGDSPLLPAVDEFTVHVDPTR